MDLNTFEEYVRLHLLSLEQDSEEIQKQMGFYDDYDCDEYKDLEIEDISTNGQILACYHFLSVLEGNM
jgi:hypothetical protein